MVVPYSKHETLKYDSPPNRFHFFHENICTEQSFQAAAKNDTKDFFQRFSNSCQFINYGG